MQRSEASDYIAAMLYEPLLRENLIKVTQTFARHAGLGISTVARRFLGDSKLFSRIHDGGTFSVRFYDRSVSRFAENWPDDLPWPEGVPRPNTRQIAKAREQTLNSRSTAWS